MSRTLRQMILPLIDVLRSVPGCEQNRSWMSTECPPESIFSALAASSWTVLSTLSPIHPKIQSRLFTYHIPGLRSNSSDIFSQTWRADIQSANHTMARFLRACLDHAPNGCRVAYQRDPEDPKNNVAL